MIGDTFISQVNRWMKGSSNANIRIKLDSPSFTVSRETRAYFTIEVDKEIWPFAIGRDGKNFLMSLLQTYLKNALT